MQEVGDVKLPPLPAEPVGQRFLQYFNHPWKFIFAPVPSPGEPTRWITENSYPLQPRNLWNTYRNPNILVGLRFGSKTRYQVIDIDRDSSCHPANNRKKFKSVLHALEGIGLCRPMIVRSSDSGGLHIYYFLAESVPTFGLACAVKFALEDAGLHLIPGELETFPNVKAYKSDTPSNYNAHRLPLQSGSWWLDDYCWPLTNDLASFLDAADMAASGQDLTELLTGISAALQRQKLLYYPSTSGKAEKWKRDLEERIAIGWTGRGQTNELLTDFACYGIVWLGLADDALVDYVVQTAMNSPGYHEYCGHQQEILKRAREWAQCCLGFYTPYCSYPNRSHSYLEQFGDSEGPANNIVEFKPGLTNSQRRDQARERIQNAMGYLRENDSLPKGIRARTVAIAAASKALTGSGVSYSTLNKPEYLPLWHPKYIAQRCVIDQPEPIPVESTLVKVEIEPEPHPQPELPEPSPIKQESHNPSKNHTPPLNEGLYVPLPCDALQEQSHDAVLNNRGEFEGGIDVVAAAPVLVENAAVPASATPADWRRITTLRLEAVRHAQRAVRIQMLTAGQVIQGPERTHLEQVAKFKFYLDSGEAALIKEARVWAIANPGALPSVLQNADSLLRNLTNPPLDEATTPNPAELASHQSPTAASSDIDSASAAAAELEPSTKPPPTMPPPAKSQQQGSNRRLQPVEILASAGDWD